MNSDPGMMNRRARAVLAIALASGLALVSTGCGDDGLGKRYPVSGTITYKGEPVASAVISFYPAGGPTEEQRGATGVVENGRYTLSTQGNDDGAFPGDYLVAIIARSADMTQAKRNAEKTGGMLSQSDVGAAYAKAKSSIPTKYESPDAGLKAKVEPRRNTFDFDLVD